jgi:hypothetical protein
VENTREEFERLYPEAHDKLITHCLVFISSLGVSTGSCNEFCEFQKGEERQGARYLWLMFAYLIALDEEKEGLL